MKNFLLSITSLTLCLALVGCGESNGDNTSISTVHPTGSVSLSASASVPSTINFSTMTFNSVTKEEFQGYCIDTFYTMMLNIFEYDVNELGIDDVYILDTDKFENVFRLDSNYIRICVGFSGERQSATSLLQSEAKIGDSQVQNNDYSDIVETDPFQNRINITVIFTIFEDSSEIEKMEGQEIRSFHPEYYNPIKTGSVYIFIGSSSEDDVNSINQYIYNII